jgi:hypothetical protein
MTYELEAVILALAAVGCAGWVVYVVRHPRRR